MKISAKLPQFGKETVLLIVTGQLGAAFYLARNGELTKAASFELRKPKYSDHEGKFLRRGRGKIFAAGAVYEFDKQGMIKEFLRELEGRTKVLMTKYKVTASYLYAPAHLIQQIKTKITKILGSSYVMSFRGNYHNCHPFELLEMIGARKARRAVRQRVAPTNREVIKILRRQ